MTYKKVCHYLSLIPTSEYYGVDKREIPLYIERNNAYIYLNDLIIINDKIKSDLYKISQLNGESISLSDQSRVGNLQLALE